MSRRVMSAATSLVCLIMLPLTTATSIVRLTLPPSIIAMNTPGLTLLPSILLSGYIAPRETLPTPLYLLSEIFPVTHFIQISRGIVVRGAGLSDLMPSVNALLILAAVLTAAATTRFRKSMS